MKMLINVIIATMLTLPIVVFAQSDECDSASSLNAIKEVAIENGFDGSSINITKNGTFSDPKKDVYAYLATLSDAKGNNADFVIDCKTNNIYSPQLSELKVTISLWIEMQRVGDNIKIPIMVFKDLSSEPSNKVAKTQLKQSGMTVSDVNELRGLGSVMFIGGATESDLYKISKLSWIEEGAITLNAEVSATSLGLTQIVQILISNRIVQLIILGIGVLILFAVIWLIRKSKQKFPITLPSAIALYSNFIFVDSLS